MADTMQFELVSPERRLAAMEAREVRVPGSEGDLTAMPDHAPTIATLRPGILQATGPGGEAGFLVTGGFAEITPKATSVLAERAMPVAEVTAQIMDELAAEARRAAEAALPENRDAADKVVADLAQARAMLGL